MAKKITTYVLDGGGCNLICRDIDNLIDTLKIEIENAEDPEEGRENAIEFTVRIERTMTDKQCDDLPDWDGF